MKKILKNQNGMSMVNVMMAAAMAGGLALVIAQLGKNSSKVQRGAKISFEQTEFQTRIQKYMSNHDSCITTLSQAGPLQVGVPKQINSIKTNFKGVIKDQVVAGEKIAKGAILILSKIEVNRKDVNKIELKFYIKKPTTEKNRSFGAKDITKTIEIDAQFNGNTIEKCYSQLDGVVTTANSYTDEAIDDAKAYTDTAIASLPSVAEYNALKSRITAIENAINNPTYKLMDTTYYPWSQLYLYQHDHPSGSSVNLCHHGSSTKAAWISQSDSCPKNSGYVSFSCPGTHSSASINCTDLKEESGGECGGHRNRTVRCKYVQDISL